MELGWFQDQRSTEAVTQSGDFYRVGVNQRMKWFAFILKITLKNNSLKVTPDQDGDKDVVDTHTHTHTHNGILFKK